MRRVGVTDALYIPKYFNENMAYALVSTLNVKVLIPNNCFQASGSGSIWGFRGGPVPWSHRVQAVRIVKTNADCQKTSRRPMYSYGPHVQVEVKGRSQWSPKSIKKPKVNSSLPNCLRALQMKRNGEGGLFIDNARDIH